MYENDPTMWGTKSCGINQLNSSIFTATDKDKNAKLTMDIDWSESKAYKYNLPVDVTEYDYRETILMSVDQGEQTNEIVGHLVVSDVKFIDKERVDRLELVIFTKDTDAGYEQRNDGT